MTRRDHNSRHFETAPGAPAPLARSVKRRIPFGHVDLLGIAWHGRYAAYFEEASTEVRRHGGLSYPELLAASLRVPIVQLHVEYLQPLLLDEEVTIRAELIWTEAARLNFAYRIVKENGELAATGYSTQLFCDGATGAALAVSPPLWEQCRKKWAAGGFRWLQS